MLKKRFLIAAFILVISVGYLYIDQKRVVIISKNETTLSNLGFSEERIFKLLSNRKPAESQEHVTNINYLYDEITKEIGLKEKNINRQVKDLKTLESIEEELEDYYKTKKEQYETLTERNDKLLNENNLKLEESWHESLLEKYLRQQELLILNDVREVCENTEYEGILIANKSNCLDYDFVSPLMDERIEQQKKMLDAAASDGVEITVLSSYREFDYQKILFDKYVNDMGYQAAASLSAIPGTSEHQTGLAVDFGAADGKCTLESCYSSTREGKWLKDNAHKYGFVLRYQLGKKSITGYEFEPWHYRYVGVETATNIYDESPEETIEEYLGIDYPIYYK